MYLSIQIRNSANVDRAHIRANLTEGSQELVRLTIEHSDLIIKANTNSVLTPEERFQLLQIHRFAFRSYENYTYQFRLGLFDESEWRGLLNAITAAFSNAYVQEDWRAIRTQFSEATQAIIDPLIPVMIDEAKAPTAMPATRNE
jgi:hypothetical protein